MKGFSPLEAYTLMLADMLIERKQAEDAAREVEGAFFFDDIPKSASLQTEKGNMNNLLNSTRVLAAEDALSKMAGLRENMSLPNEEAGTQDSKSDKDKRKETALAGLLGGGAGAFLDDGPDEKKTQYSEILQRGKTASVKEQILQHKDKPWFYPAVGGLSAAILASPEIFQDIQDDRSPQAIRRLMLSAGLGAGLGYAGGKVLRGEAQDLKRMLESIKNKNQIS